jgi:signal transduction histidine kinase
MKISSRILLGFSFIILLFGIVTYVNTKLFEDVNTNSAWLTKSSEIIRSSNNLQRSIIDMENGLKGFLLTGEQHSLEPFPSSDRQSITLFKELRTLLQDSPYQVKKIDSIQVLHEQWKKTFAEPFIAIKGQALLSDEINKDLSLLLRKEIKNHYGINISNKIRFLFKELNAYEYKLREERRSKLQSSIHKASLISKSSIAMAIVFGLGTCLYLTKIISKRIERMVVAAEKISQGDFKVFISEISKDELNRLSEALNIMAKKLDESFTELEQFANIVSHDLKAPLRGIENVIRWMEEDKGELITSETKEYMTMIKSRTHRMESFIEGILKLARIGKGHAEISYVNIDLLLSEVIELLNPPKSIKIHIGKMPIIISEKFYLLQVFQNLISNAIKYHNKIDGNIWIIQKDLGDYYEFVIKDDGPGIEPMYHEKIFIVFQTLQERDAFESTGVGLSIVKKIIDKKKGIIKVISEKGKGASFVFTWPKQSQFEL